MQYYNNTLAIEPRLLINEGIMSQSAYKHLVCRGDIKILRRGCSNTPALAAFDSIPERFRKEVYKIIPDPHKAASINQVEQRIEHNAEASVLFENFRLPDGRYLKQDTRREYYANAVVLDAIHRLISDKRSKITALGHRAKRAWEQICEGVMELDRVKFPHSLPANPRRLEERYKQYMHEGPQCLIHKNYMNKSAAKINDETKSAFLMQLLGDPRNLDNEQVRGLYNQVADKMNWKQITASTVAIWRDKMDTTIHAGRRGETSFRNSKEMQAKRSAPTFPLFYLTLDGWDVELLYQRTDTDKNGHNVTTYHHRPTVVVVLDPCFKYPLGFSVGTHETPELIRAALRDAVRHTEQLFGKMHRAHQVQSDRHAIKAMTPYYEVIGEKVTPARAHNAKAKVIEPYFNYLNKTYFQLFPNWSGFGITSDQDNQPNASFLNKYKKDFPDFDGVCRIVEQVMMRERASKVQQYVERWNQLPDNDRLPVNKENYLLWFGEKTGFTNMLTGSGLNPTIMGIKRSYDCFDLSFRDHYSTKWEVLYDPDDLTRALAVNEDQTLRYMLEEKHIQPMALKERKPGDSDQLQRIREYNRDLETKVIETRARATDLVLETIAQNPALEETTLRKLLITDSQGQHKRQLGAAKRALPESGFKGGKSDDDIDESTYFLKY